MHRIEASGLEAIGDFFLTPARYLFGGQDIVVDHDQFKLQPSFHYGDGDWFKTTLSLIALPLGEIVGCAFKAASLLSNETREHYNVIYENLEDTTVVSNIPLYLKKGLKELKTHEPASCQNYCRPSQLSPTRQQELAVLKEVCRLLDDNGIIYWLDCGSCLGAYRYGGMIPWDDDIDIAILTPDHDNVKKILKTLNPEKFQVQDWSSYRYPKTFIKLYLKETKTLIDIYHYDLDETTRTVTYFYSYKDSPLPEKWKVGEFMMTKPLSYDVIFPLRPVIFDGVATWVPNQIEKFLHSKYGTNLNPTMVWDEKTATYRKVKDHPYWKSLEVQ
jgi:hypothetical protein